MRLLSGPPPSQKVDHDLVTARKMWWGFRPLIYHNLGSCSILTQLLSRGMPSCIKDRLSRHRIQFPIFRPTCQAWKGNAFSWMTVAMLIVSTGTIFHISPVHASSSYTVHSSIRIIGNSGFTQPNGVTGGAGTRSDPYLIEGWSIVAANGQAAIETCSF